MRIFLASVFFVPLSFCFGQIAKVERYNICHYKQKVYRTIRVENYGSIGCDTVYTKRGKEVRAGGGVYLASCERVFSNITANLEEGDWSCTEIGNSQFTIEDSSKITAND